MSDVIIELDRLRVTITAVSVAALIATVIMSDFQKRKSLDFVEVSA